MEEYLFHWWAGDLKNYYHPLGFTMAQLNKLLKIGQYLFGLMVLFELVQFSTVMKQFRSVIYSYYIFIELPWALISGLLTLIPMLIFGFVDFVRGKVPGRDVFKSIILQHLKSKAREVQDDAQNQEVVTAFQWLAEHPLPDRARRIIVFLAFAFLTLGDLLTS